MVKRWFWVAGVLALGALWVSGSWAGMIGPSLQQVLSTASPGQKIPVCIALKQQADNAALERACVSKTKEQRWAYVVGELKRLSAETQRDLLSSLASQEASGQVTRVNSLWIVNEVYCEATPEAIQTLAARPEVWFVDYDLVPATLNVDQAGQKATGTASSRSPGMISATPNPGPSHVNTVEPNVHLVGADSVWNLLGYTGNGVVVGHIDTGCRYTHQDLANHMWTSSSYPHPGYNYASSLLWGSRGNTYDTLDPMDYAGHGTHTSGIVCADGNYGNGTHDTMGIAPSAKILSTAVLTSLVSPYPDTILEISCFDGMQFCVAPTRDPGNHAHVLTMSLGLINAWSPRQAVWRQAETNVMNAGIVHCVAAGNEGPGNRTLRCPGDVPGPWHHPSDGTGGQSGVVTIGATDNTDAYASFTSWGPARWDTVTGYGDYPDPPGLMRPDVSAPGVNILSTYYSSDQSYTTMSGTSMATPCAAGVVALMLSKNPNLLPWQVDSILQMTVRPLGYQPKNDTFGTGRVSAYQTVLHTPFAYAQFALSAQSADTVSPNSTVVDSVTVSSMSSFSSPVTMTLDSIRPPEPTITVGFSPNPVTPPPNGSVKTGMSITTQSGTPQNNYMLYYHGTGDTVTRRSSLNLWVTLPTFTLQSKPRKQSVFSADSASYADTVVSISGYNSPCTLSATVNPPTPSITVSFLPDNVVIPTDGRRMKVQTTGGTPPGTYVITSQAQNGGTVRTVDDTLVVKFPVQGPDAYGYYSYDNTDIGFLNSPVYSWVEINPNRGGSGTTVGAGGDDPVYQQAMTGIGVKHYGTNFTNASICSNGWLAMGTTTSYWYTEYPLPSTNFVPNGVAIFWDDLRTDQAGNTWWYYCDTANHRFVVEWDSVSLYRSVGTRETFEALIYDTTQTPSTAPTHDSEIILQWKAVNDITSMCVGQQNTAMNVGLGCYCDGTYDPQMAPIVAGRATKYTTDPPRLVSGVELLPIGLGLPLHFALGPAVPNPSSGYLAISYDLPVEAQVSLKVYNLSGQLVRTLVSGKEQAGFKRAAWDGLSDKGSRVASGVYFYRLEAGSFTATKKMVVVR